MQKSLVNPILEKKKFPQIFFCAADEKIFLNKGDQPVSSLESQLY
jgi:hypothetical protein